MDTKREEACRIIARSLFRELAASGYETPDFLAVATELLDLIVRDARRAAADASPAPAITTRAVTVDAGKQGLHARPVEEPMKIG